MARTTATVKYEDEITYIITMQVADLPPELSSGERGFHCYFYGGEVYMMPRSQEMAKGPDTRVVCNRCVDGTVDDPETILPPEPQQVEGINAFRRERGLSPVTAEEIHAVALQRLLKRRTDD